MLIFYREFWINAHLLFRVHSHTELTFVENRFREIALAISNPCGNCFYS